MKKSILAIALILSVTVMSAQTPAQQAIDKAKAAANDAKKAAKTATWITLAKAYVDAYDLPTKSLLPNSSQAEVKMFLKGQQVLGTSNKTCLDANYIVDSYADKDLYYNERGALDFWIVTKPAAEGDLLGEAIKAYVKAAEVDNGSKTKDIVEGLENIHSKLDQDARSYYLAGEFAKAAKLFKQSTEAYSNKAVNKVDSANTYYTALVANLAGDKAQAIEYYKQCIDWGYYQEGNVFANLAEIYKGEGKAEDGVALLEEGFGKCPSSQAILVGLINHYRESGNNPQRIFDLLHQAQANEPKNASLFYVEGDVYKQLGDTENAAKLYEKSSQIDPTYIFGTLGIGILYYDKAVDLQTAASEELDDAKYTALMKDMESTLSQAIAPFEKAFANSDDDEIKLAVAEYLKNIYFRLRDKDESYPALYEKYNKLVQGE